VAGYLLLTGVTLLVARTLVIMPALRSLRAMSEADLALLITAAGKTLTACGLTLLLWIVWRRRRAKTQQHIGR
jgi:ABC-type xylose transport system permease subunit